MPKILRDNFQQLFETADAQGGFFTAKQATAVGFSTRMQTYKVQSGEWEREWRGIYRLRFYPNPRPDDLMVWYLWSSDRAGKPEGVYSHDTALELHKLSTWSGNKLHMTVPPGFKRRVVPRSLRLHQADLRHFEITQIDKVAVTTAVKTILDLAYSAAVPHHHLVEAMQEATTRGLLTQSDLVSPWLTEKDKQVLMQLAVESRTHVTEA
jgi:predicted transcriptional regulator of viral defense system